MLVMFNTDGAISEAETAIPSGAPDFTPAIFSGVRVTQSLVLCVCFVDSYKSVQFNDMMMMFALF